MNKVLKHYQHHKNRSKTGAQMVALVFNQCSVWVENIAQSLLEKDYYGRYQASEKVIMALTNLIPLFDTSTKEQEIFAKDIHGFCFLILANITDINQKEDYTLCLQTRQLLKEMADIWQKI